MYPQEEIYLVLLESLYPIISLSAQDTPNEYTQGFIQIARRIFSHAVTVRHLRSGCEIPIEINGFINKKIIDFPTAVILTRVVYEAYLNLFEVYVEPQDEDRQKYTHNVYLLYGQLHKTAVEKPRPQNKDGHETALQNIKELQRYIRSTKFYKSLDNNQKTATVDFGTLFFAEGKQRKGFVERWKASGMSISKQNTVVLYKLASSYIHADSLSNLHLYRTSSIDEEMQRIDTCLTELLTVMLRLYVHCKQHNILQHRLPNDETQLKLLLKQL